MTFQYKLPTRRSRSLPLFPTDQTLDPVGHPARIARLVALGHKLESMLESSNVKDYGALARQEKVCSGRVAQIVVLSQLAPDIQEYVLFLSAEHAGMITELQLREIARETNWSRQRQLFTELVTSVS